MNMMQGLREWKSKMKMKKRKKKNKIGINKVLISGMNTRYWEKDENEEEVEELHDEDEEVED